MRPVRTWRALMIACALCAVGASPALAGPAYTPITGSPFAAPSTSTSAWTAALNPNGTLLATPSFFGSSVTMFKVDPGSGTMTALGATDLTTVANGQIGNPVAVAFANAGATSYLAVVGEGGPNNVALYSVTSAGALTLIKAVTLGGLIEGVALQLGGDDAGGRDDFSGCPGIQRAPTISPRGFCRRSRARPAGSHSTRAGHSLRPPLSIRRSCTCTPSPATRR